MLTELDMLTVVVVGALVTLSVVAGIKALSDKLWPPTVREVSLPPTETEHTNRENVTVSNTVYWIYGKPPNAESKVLLLTTGRIATIGRWGDGNGVIAWCPLPKRDKGMEERLGL